MKKMLTALAIICLSTSTFAAKKDMRDEDDYDSDFYKKEGSILLKVKASGIFSKAKNTSLPTPPKTGVAAPVKVGSVISNGVGIDGSATVFFGDYLAGEAGVGFNLYRTSSGALNAIGNNYSATAAPAPLAKKKNIYAVPVSLMLQYHVAPFGALRPYLGVGYQYTYMLSKAKQFTINSAGGYAIQAGLDFAMTDDTVISFDIKRYKLEPKIKYKDSFLGVGKGFATKLKINPVIISLGMGWKF
jgi:outer membrane protein